MKSNAAFWRMCYRIGCSELHSSLCSLLINSTPAHDVLVVKIGWPGALLHCLEAVGMVSSPNHAQKVLPWYQRRSKSQRSEGMSVLTIHFTRTR